MTTSAVNKEYALYITDTSGRLVVCVDYTGKVEIGSHLTLDEASQAFWTSLKAVATSDVFGVA